MPNFTISIGACTQNSFSIKVSLVILSNPHVSSSSKNWPICNWPNTHKFIYLLPVLFWTWRKDRRFLNGNIYAFATFITSHYSSWLCSFVDVMIRKDIVDTEIIATERRRKRRKITIPKTENYEHGFFLFNSLPMEKS